MRSTFAIVRTSPTVLPSPHLNNREFKIPRQRRPRKRRSKSKFAFLQCLSQLFQLIYFVKCKRTLFEPNCKETYPASERDRLFSRRLVMSFIKREIRHFSVAVVQWRQRNVQKRRDARAVVAFAFSPLLFWRSRCRRRRYENKRELKQQRFWGTNVNRKLTFSINGQWFGSNSRVNRLYKRKENYHYKFVSVKTYKKGGGLTSGWRASLKNVFA